MKRLPPSERPLRLVVFLPFLLVGMAVPSIGSTAPHAVRSEAVSVKKDLRAKKSDLKTVQRRLEREKKMRAVAERRETRPVRERESSIDWIAVSPLR